MKFKYGQEVEIVGEPFYEGVVGTIVRRSQYDDYEAEYGIVLGGEDIKTAQFWPASKLRLLEDKKK